MNMGGFKDVSKMVEVLLRGGGKVYFVGGCVRDLDLGIPSKDIDVEVYGLEENELERILRGFGNAQKVGKSFGVWKCTLNGCSGDGHGRLDVDVAIPRREVKVRAGHTGFSIELDPYMEPRDAASRRDYTVNALMLSAGSDSDNEIIDFFGGIADLDARILRHVSDKHFVEDPLRPLRAMQFAGRFGMTLDEGTAKLCKSMFAEGVHEDLPVERVWGEFEKWALKSPVPSKGLQALVDMGWIGMFPELEALIGLEQDIAFHPEGDVFTHTMCTVDEMVKMVLESGIGGEDRIVQVLAALCHDFGKVTTTTWDEEDGKIRSKRHAKEGRAPTEIFLRRIGAPRAVIDRVIPLVAEHMIPWIDKPTDRAIRRLASRLAPATIGELHMVIRADYRGRPPLEPKDPFEELAEIAGRLELMDDGPAPILMGRHLMEKGVKPCPLMGDILRQAFEAQLDGEFGNLEEALAWFDDVKEAFDE